MHTNVAGRVAAILVGLEGIGLGVVVVREVVALATGDTASAPSGVALLVLTAVAAVALVAFAIAVWRGRSWGRSGAIVAQALILAVALGAATGAFADPLVGIVLAVPALVTLVLVILAARHAAPVRDAPDSPDAP